jgi:tripartite-type tricarboxylate transporter receptor subunit TctC
MKFSHERSVRWSRRKFLCIAGGSVALQAALRSANAQTYPARPITLIVPYPAGTATDTTLRAFASAAQKHLGQPFVIENKPGAGGTIAPAQMAQSAKPDGYTICQIPLPLFRAPFMRKTTYDPATDFTYIIGLTGYIYGIVVRPDSPWKTFQDLLADAKARPGKITFGTPGANTTQHVTMLQIAKLHGIDWVHVPFKGTPESMSALLGGHLDVSADTTAWGPQVNEGKLRLLVTFGAVRTKSWPNAPTLRDLGIDIVSESPYGLAGPKGMDPTTVKILHDAFHKAMDDPALTATMRQLDQEFRYRNTEDYLRDVLQQIEEQKRLVADLNLSP